MARNDFMEVDELQLAADSAARARAAAAPNLPAVVEPVRTTPPALGLDYLPDADELDRLFRLADTVSRSGIVPTNYRSTVAGDGRLVQDKRPNVMVAALMGRTFGWDLLTAMRNIHVIEGAASLKPEALLGLIRARGHVVRIIRGVDRVDAHGKRADTGDVMAAGFSFEDAYRANLAHPGENGMPRARSTQGKPLPWEQYPLDMCQWRAVAIIARGLFSDIALGLAYTPEELGAIVDAEGAVIVESAPLPDKPAERRPTPADTPAEEHRARAKAHAAEQHAARHAPGPDELPDPPTGPTLEEELAAAAARRQERDAKRHASELDNAKARAWDAMRDLYPDEAQAKLLERVRDELHGLTGKTLTDAGAGDFVRLAESLEGDYDARIRIRHGATIGDDNA